MYSEPLVGVFILKIPYGRINGECIKEEKGICSVYVTAAAASWAHSVLLLRPNKAIKTMEWPLCVCVRAPPFFGALIQNSSSSSAASGPAGRPGCCLANNCIMETIK
jgi:hypothetical protein